MKNNPNYSISKNASLTKVWLLFYLFWPFGAMVHALNNFRSPKAKTLFWLFCVYFGFVFVYAEPFIGGADSARYAAKLIEMSRSVFTFDALVASFYEPTTGVVDIYEPIVIWIVSIFTSEPRFLFMIFAMVFGFFYMKNIWLVFENVDTRIGLFLFFLLLGFALINPIWNINGVRMYTAAQVFLYGILLYFLKTEKKGLVWSASSFLIHFSFLFPIIILFTFIFIPKNVKLLFAFFLVTRFFVEIELSGVRELLYNLPEAFIPRVEGYTSETYAALRAEKAQSLNWYVVYLSAALRWFITIWVILLFSKYQIWKKSSPHIAKLFLFTLFIGSFANLAAQVPSGGRFFVLSDSLLLVVLISLIGINRTYWIPKIYQYVTLPLLILGLILKIRLGLSFISLNTIIGNPIIASFLEVRTPLIEYLDWLI